MPWQFRTKRLKKQANIVNTVYMCVCVYIYIERERVYYLYNIVNRKIYKNHRERTL